MCIKVRSDMLVVEKGGNGNMKFIYSIVSIIVIIFIALFGWKLYAESHTDNPTSRNLANLNPLIQSETYYVKIGDPIKVKKLDDDITEYTYKSKAYNKNGKYKHINYTATKKLKKDHYLALNYKVGEVKSYKEVAKSQIPKKANKIIE
jgi:uncharacterized protein (TIGR01655 family)